MSTIHVIQTVFEFLMVIAFVFGFKYETQIAKWERKQAKKIVNAFKKFKGCRQ